MPNIRQLRKRGSKGPKWTKEAMGQAMQEVQAGRQTLRHAAKQFGVPKSSLSDRLSGRVAMDCFYGQSQLLSPEDESSLVEYCLFSASHGCPLRKYQVVAQALAIYNYRNPHKPRTVLGQTWWINFRERNHHRLTSKTPDVVDHGDKRRTNKRASVKGVPLSRLPPPESPPSSPSSDPYLTHPLVASGRITVDLARVLSKTNQTCEIRKLRRSAYVLTAQEVSEVIKKVEDGAARAEGRSVTRPGEEDPDPAVSSSTVPGGSRLRRTRRLPPGAHPDTGSGAAGPSALFVPPCASHSASIGPSSTPSNMSWSSDDRHHKAVEASNLWQTSSMPLAPPSAGSSSSSSTAEPTASTGHVAAKKKKCERQILRCGRCRQPHPPQDPEGLVLWVQCDNCHKMFHTTCVSSEMDVDDDEFWCFWCLDV
ncbi:uncharacterized protein [Cebidichthys violaceus]|uniref:uncharacterized protein n=1 Tax=Cebidichthys violaceus TaxID=271503 RepID=UPI0035CACC0C